MNRADRTKTAKTVETTGGQQKSGPKEPMATTPSIADRPPEVGRPFDDLGLTEQFHRMKRTAILASALLVISFVPAAAQIGDTVGMALGNPIGAHDRAVVQLLLFLGAAYYVALFWIEWRRNKHKRSGGVGVATDLRDAADRFSEMIAGLKPPERPPSQLTTIEDRVYGFAGSAARWLKRFREAHPVEVNEGSNSDPRFLQMIDEFSHEGFDTGPNVYVESRWQRYRDQIEVAARHAEAIQTVAREVKQREHAFLRRVERSNHANASLDAFQINVLELGAVMATFALGLGLMLWNGTVPDAARRLSNAAPTFTGHQGELR